MKHHSNPTAQFFSLPTGSPAEVIRIAENLKRQNARTGFINTLIVKEGYAVWDNVEVKMPTQNNARITTNNNDTIIYIPLVLENTNYVNSFIYATLNGSINLRLYRGREYANYGFGDINSDTDNAERLALQIMMLDNRVFGYTDFLLKDSRLFNRTNTLQQADSPKRMIKIQAAGNTAGRGAGNRGHWESGTVTTCTSNTVYHCTHTGACANGVCDGCYLCEETTVNCETVVQYYFVADPDTPGNNGPGGGAGGSAGGNGGGVIPDGPVPCNPMPELDSGILPCEAGNMTGWTVSDANGFLYTRIAELKEKLVQDKFALTPCDSTILMPMMAYGPMYQKVSQHKVPQAVLDRLDSLTFASILTESALTVQSLDSAYGAVVNCDFFPIRITQLPTTANGTLFTPKDLLEYFRLNKNDFISPSIGVSFEPYSHQSFNDSTRFKAAFEQSIGAILHIDMQNDGSIAQTGYTNYINPITNYQDHSFIYTTLSTSLDFDHPVSGNREFGIYTEPNNPGTYVFYTM